MFNTRYAQTDPDIDLDKIKSPILQNLIGRYDCIVGTEEDQRELYFIDPYKKFFFSVLDRTAWFDLKNPPANYTGATSVLLPVIRAIYVSRVHRGKGLQETILKDILSICDETGCSIAIYADPFQIRNNGQYNLSYITQALAAFAQFGYEPTDNYEWDLVKQRERFFNVGFKNCVYADATTTEPWQHFMYVPSTAPEPVKMLQNELEVHYDINWAYFNKEGNGAD